MDMTKADIKKTAKQLGIDDVRFAKAEDFLFSHGETPRGVLSNATCVIVIFVRYTPAAAASKGYVSLSAYYVASNRAYHAARKLTDIIIENGGNAVFTTKLPCKSIALQTGGSIGDNGFYYHPKYGSFVCIQTIVTNAAEPDIYENAGKECIHCGVCKQACPSDAVGNVENCLRKHIHHLIPENIRGDVYQLIGCERCQTACPLNDPSQSQPYVFPLDELLEGKHLNSLKKLVGPNYARKQRILSQAVLLAAKTKAVHLKDQILKISETAPSPVREHALWALKQLEQSERQV